MDNVLNILIAIATLVVAGLLAGRRVLRRPRFLRQIRISGNLDISVSEVGTARKGVLESENADDD